VHADALVLLQSLADASDDTLQVVDKTAAAVLDEVEAAMLSAAQTIVQGAAHKTDSQWVHRLNINCEAAVLFFFAGAVCSQFA
jgi:hypothetical protein